MLKKITAILFCFMMILSVSYASEITDIDDATKTDFIPINNTYTLTLEEAINMALDNNPQLNACLEKKRIPEYS